MSRIIDSAYLTGVFKEGGVIEGGVVSAAELIRAIKSAVRDGNSAHQGIRMKGVRVEGSLDLSAVTNSGDAVLWPLDFDGCIFTDQIRLDRGRYKRVSLRDCRFRRFQARDAEFESSLDLRGVSTPGAAIPCSDRATGRRYRKTLPDECSIDLANALIDGDIWLGRAELKVGDACGEEGETGPKPYALILRGSEIKGAARLEPDFQANGGVSIADIRIHGDFRAHGARLTAVHGAALRGQNARIDGTVFCRDKPLTRQRGEGSGQGRFVAQGKSEGGLIFQNAHLGRIELHGALITAAPPIPSSTRDIFHVISKAGPTRPTAMIALFVDRISDWRRFERSTPTGLALDLSHSVIKAGVVGSSLGRQDLPHPEAEFFGIVTLRSADITGDIIFTGARVDASDADWVNEAVQSLEPTRSTPYRASGHALDLRATSTNGTLRLDGGFTAKGGVGLSNASIVGDVFMFDAWLGAYGRPDGLPTSRSAPLALTARNLKLNGAFRGGGVGRLSGGGGGGDDVPPTFKPLHCAGGVSFAGAQADKIDLGGVTISGGREGLNLSQCTVRGPIYFNIIPDESHSAGKHQPRLKGPLRMLDAVVLGDLNIEALLEEGEKGDGPPILQGDGLKVHGSLSLTQTYDADDIESAPIDRILSLKSAWVGRNIKINYTKGDTRILAETLVVAGEFCVTQSDGARVDMIIPSANIGQRLAISGGSICGLFGIGLSTGNAFSLEGCDLAGPVELDRAEIGGSVRLLRVPFGKKGRDWLRPDTHIDPQETTGRGYAGVFLNGATVSGSLKIRELGDGLPNSIYKIRDQVVPSCVHKFIDDELHRLEDSSILKEKHKDYPPHIDLSFATIDKIDDLSGSSWSLGLSIVIRGLVYNTLYFDEADGFSEKYKSAMELHENQIAKKMQLGREKWENLLILSGLSIYVISLIMISIYFSSELYNSNLYILLAVLIICAPWIIYCYGRYQSSKEKNLERVRGRLMWLSQQFTGSDVILREYYPQPYTQVAKVYRAQGLHSFADTILIRRCRYDAKAKLQTLRTLTGKEKSVTPSRFVLSRFSSVMAWTFDVTFRYGLSGRAAAITFAAYTAVGWSLSMAELSIPNRSLMLRGGGAACESTTYSWVRAFDSFIPRLGADPAACEVVVKRQPARMDSKIVLAASVGREAVSTHWPDSSITQTETGWLLNGADTRSNSRESQRRAGPPPVDLWSITWSLYRFVGWVVLSLTILTLSGLLRRFAEH